MSFFESIPQPPPPERVRQRRQAWERSDAVIPASVPADVMLIRTERVAVAIGNIRAYPNGFEFRLSARLRSEDETELECFDPTGMHGHLRRSRVPEDVLRLGIMYADGRRAAIAGGRCWPDDDDDDERLILVPNGSGGSERTWDGDFWVYPLPPDGPVTFVTSWLEHGVAETRAELDSAAVREAAARAVALWPEDQEREVGPSWTSRTFSGFVSDEPGEEAGPD
jgi:hypothetical protein